MCKDDLLSLVKYLNYPLTAGSRLGDNARDGV
jgi:hypothetical protein